MQALRTASRDAERRAGVSAAQLFALHELSVRSGASINDLAATTYTHQSSVSVVVRRLVERGLVDRRAAAHDRRQVQLELTARGRAILRRAPEPVQQRLIEAISALPPDRRALFARALREIADGVSSAGGAPAMFFEERDRRAGVTSRTASRSPGS